MKIRWGVLGCGDVVRKRVARAILGEPRSALVAACRRHPERLREFAEHFGVERASTDAAEVLSDPGIDAVYIATPVHLHAPQTVAAAERGKHVLVEKPMAMSTAECDEMIAACRQHGVRLGVAFYRRFYPMVARMEELIAAGEIGRPLSVSAVTSNSFAIDPGDDGYWRVLPAEGGGGSLMDIGSHRLNLFLHLFGEIDVVKACCDTVAASYAAEDCASLVLRFRSGPHGSLQCFFGTGVGADEFTIIGTRGKLQASPLNGSELEVVAGSRHRLETHPPPENFNAPQIADFVSAILDDRPPRVTGEEGRRTSEVMERAYGDAG